MKNQKVRQNKAFSLIELSVVLIIIGLLIAGIVAGKQLISLSALTSARALTESSPVAGMEDLTLWLEATSKKSFNPSQPDNDSEVLLWKDINPQSSSKINAAGIATQVPRYTDNSINSLPALEFDGTELLGFDGDSVFYNSPFTLFVVNRGKSDDSFGERYWIGSSSGHFRIGNAYTGISLSVDVSGTGSFVPLPSMTSDIPRILTFSWQLESRRMSVWHNSSLLALNRSIGSTGPPPNGLTYYIGMADFDYYTGAIGEIIVFRRVLSDFERIEVEKYLSKKWGIN